MQADGLTGGFADPARQSARAFRAIMDAMARPGAIRTLLGVTAPAPLSGAAGALILTLCDTETPIHLAGAVDCRQVREWIAFHTGAPLVGKAACMFAAGSWQDLLPLEGYQQGTAEYPDRSATLIVETVSLRAEGAQLSGPGIQSTAALSLPDGPAFVRNSARYPLGLDFFFTCDTRLAALPRTTKVRHPAEPREVS